VVLFYSFALFLFFGFRNMAEPELTFLLNPIPLLVLLFAVFFSRELSFAMTLIYSTLFSFVVPVSISHEVFFVSLLGSLLGVFSVSSQQSRRVDITKAGILIGVGNFLLLLGGNLTHVKYLGEISFESIYLQPIYGFFNGILCAIFALGAIPIIEVFFRITTSTRLLELLQPTQPLLQKLLAEAPGTYHHSMLVADLAEKAAEAIHADPLLAKAAAFYHDIGKIKRPFFFAENQLGGVNFHDNLQPSLSSLIITSHIHDGLEIGKEYNLPKTILDIIVQHHGTDLVAFFHNKAKQAESDTNTVQEETFRYEGRKPQTKEAGIVMISDAVEAASRTLLKPTPASIDSLVRRIIDRKDEDGQFDECDLTKKDLELVADRLTKSLVSMFHARIKYPDEIVEPRKVAKS
jgi:putative nucleotidyltransferase with HDIG domain